MSNDAKRSKINERKIEDASTKSRKKLSHAPPSRQAGIKRKV